MKLIEREWNNFVGKYTNVWLADDATELAADFDPESAEGSIVMVIGTGETYIKNTQLKWQKYGTDEVIS